MKATMIILSLVMNLVMSVATASANSATSTKFITYLPFVANQSLVADNKANAVFTLDHTRLWDIAEAGGQPGSAPVCSNSSEVQVHVFDNRGDSGITSRLNGVIVQVVYYEGGKRVEEYHTTGRSGVDAGVVKFALKDTVEVRIFTDVNGRAISSQSAVVSAHPNAIDVGRLINSRYCSDSTSCQRFVAANRCDGQFSWNIVFKRNY